jgi:hypothetical protein
MRTFPTADAVSALAGVVVSDRKMDAVYEVLGYVVGGAVWTHQLPDAMELARQRAPMPEWLRTLDTSRCTPSTWREWIAEVIEQHGSTVEIGTLAERGT